MIQIFDNSWRSHLLKFTIEIKRIWGGYASDNISKIHWEEFSLATNSQPCLNNPCSDLHELSFENHSQMRNYLIYF
jgi:hypothetical protein